ncbi:hypothetical protein NYE69_33155 [Paenibacillus sp. FSL R5-0527]|nr:hypothetical protein [Paenibacillus macerans]MCM3701449.1 hypothetical protein [Paenibacillus macerans]
MSPEQLMKQELEKLEREGLVKRKGSAAWVTAYKAKQILDKVYGEDRSA